MRKIPTILVLSVTLLCLALALTATGCGSEEVTTTQATTAAETSTTAALEPTTTATTSTAAMASTTTTAPSRPVTTELRPGETRLDNGHVQAVGYIIDAHGSIPPFAGSVAVVPAELVTEEELAAGPSNVIQPEMAEPRVMPYGVSSAVTITVYTLGDAGEQTISLDEFLTFWSANPPAGGEHLADALWTIERDENAEVVSITESTAASMTNTQYYTKVTPAEAKELIDTTPDVVIIDTGRTWDQGHLPGALDYTDVLVYGEGVPDSVVATLDKNVPILIYEGTYGDGYMIALQLGSYGFTVYGLVGGLTAWTDAGYPVEK